MALLDWGFARDDAFVAWPPMFHMASADQAISTLAVGGEVIVVDGFDLGRIMDAIESDAQWWLVLMPGMIEQVIAQARQHGVRPKGLKRIGAMADLVPRAQIAEASALLQAPYANTFGSTETGIPPLSLGVVVPGVMPERLSKRPNALCRLKLVDPNDREVPDGAPGELAFRGPMLFSCYWNAAEANAQDFRDGWFGMRGGYGLVDSHGRPVFVEPYEATDEKRVKMLLKCGSSLSAR